MDSLATKGTLNAVRNALKTLPDELDDTYHEAIQRIECQNEYDRQLAEQVLAWIPYALRPLTSKELQHALAVQPGERGLDEGDLPDEELLTSLCAGLVVIDKESTIIRLVHYTTQEYFERIRMNRFPNAQTNIAMACLTYMSFDVFAGGYCISNEALESRLREYPLFEYAAQYWGDHARGDPQKTIKEITLMFLEHKSKLLCSHQIMCHQKYRDYEHNQSSSVGLAGLQVAASIGLEEVVQLLVEKGADVNAQGTYYGTALQAASSKGHGQVVQRLLEAGANINTQGEYDTALQLASSNGHDQIVQRLLEAGADVNAQGGYTDTALQAASAHGHDQIVQRLIEAGADVNTQGKYGTALQAASSNGHDQIVQWLLEAGADVNAQEGEYGSALQAASSEGHDQVVQRLLEAGADINAQGGRRYNTALQAASFMGYDQIVQRLLKAGADVNAQGGRRYITALQAASLASHDQIVQRLLEASANVNAQGGEYGSALQAASYEGHDQIVQRLLEAGAGFNAQGEFQDTTALHAALDNGHDQIVQRLLEAVAMTTPH